MTEQERARAHFRGKTPTQVILDEMKAEMTEAQERCDLEERVKDNILCTLIEAMNDLPQGHQEKPGLIRAIEIVRYET